MIWRTSSSRNTGSRARSARNTPTSCTFSRTHPCRRRSSRGCRWRSMISGTFAGKYKSLFIANRGTKEERLAALGDAITEVFASMFGPDPVEYRLEHGLIDHHEEMGILIQQVAGRRIGPSYLPTFAGVAFSHNEFPWSSRLKRDDGLVRLVPGLGTRAVDRLSDDYPVLGGPGQPGPPVHPPPGESVH